MVVSVGNVLEVSDGVGVVENTSVGLGIGEGLGAGCTRPAKTSKETRKLLRAIMVEGIRTGTFDKILARREASWHVPGSA